MVACLWLPSYLELSDRSCCCAAESLEQWPSPPSSCRRTARIPISHQTRSVKLKRCYNSTNIFLELISQIKSFTSQLGKSAGIVSISTSEMSTFAPPFSCLQRCSPGKLRSRTSLEEPKHEKIARSQQKTHFGDIRFKGSQQMILAEYFCQSKSSQFQDK